MIPTTKIRCKCCNVQAIANGTYNLKLMGWYKNQGYKWVCLLCSNEEELKYIW